MVEYKFADISLYENQIKDFFKKQPFGRFITNRDIEKQYAIDYEWSNLLNYAKQGEIVIAFNKTDVCGFIGFHFSKWDTEVFDKRMAFLQYFMVAESFDSDEEEISTNLLMKFHEWVKESKIQVAITKLDTQYFTPVYTLQQNGYIVYETVTLQSIDASKVDANIGSGIKFRYANELDNEELKEISLKNTFRKSHFYLDPNFSVEKIDLMYAKWIDSALKSDQKIVIVEENNQIAGVFIYDVLDLSDKIKKKIGVWKSAFVDSSFRNKGVGMRTFKAAMQSCINDDVDIIDSSLVEKNIISQSFHNKLGFRLVNTLYTFHKWFD